MKFLVTTHTIMNEMNDWAFTSTLRVMIMLVIDMSFILHVPIPFFIHSDELNEGESEGDLICILNRVQTSLFLLGFYYHFFFYLGFVWFKTC